MNFLDYAVVLIYILGFLYLGRLFKNNSSGEDYFLGNKQFGWFPLTVSTAATQLSAISFVSAPAFVGWREGGGMKWLTYEFAVPLAMAFLLVYLIPPLFASGQISVYGYLEKRFGGSTRRLLSGFFLLSRGFATSVMLYTVALILSGVMGIPMTASILVMGVVTLIYSLQGGMKAVVYGDVIQMGVLFLGILIMLGFGLHLLGGWGSFLEQVDTDRLSVVDWGKMGYGAQDDFGFFPMLIGGFFLYASYYGTDQSQVQRLFSAPDRKTLGKTLLFNGLFRFPVTLIYCIMGLVLGTFALSTPAFAEAIPAARPDYLVPIFIRDYLPHGVVGLLVVAIFSAAMSSLSSGINSLSAATVEDFFASRRKLSTEVYLRYSKYAVGFWGVICVGLAFFTGGIADTVIEAINKITSVFFGPILATFIAAIGLQRINGRAASVGLLAGVAVNVILWLGVPELFWFWWNAIGAVVTLAVGLTWSLFDANIATATSATADDIGESISREDWRLVMILVVFFVLIVLFSVYFPNFFA